MTDETPSERTGITRRRLLGSAAAVGGLSAAAMALPPNVRKALANPLPNGGKLSDIKHVVMLMQENRSFDHYFGTLSGVRGFNDPHAMRTAERPLGVLPARPVQPGRLPAALPAGHADHRRPGHPVDEPRVGRAAPGLEQRQDGQLVACAHRVRRCHRRPVHDGLLHPGRHPVPVRPRGRVHRPATPTTARCSARPAPNRHMWMAGTSTPTASPAARRWRPVARRPPTSGRPTRSASRPRA